MLDLSTARNVGVFMTDSSDHVTGKTGLTLTITASKNGAAFASIAPTVTELASGWYNVALTSSHTDTAGDLLLHVTATGADPTDVREQVRAAPAAASDLATLTANVATLTGYVDTEVAAIKAKTDSLTFTVAGQVDSNVQYVNDVQVNGVGTAGNPWGP